MTPPDSLDTRHQAESTYLSSLRRLTGHGYASVAESLSDILPLIVTQLGLRTSFFARITAADNRFTVQATYTLPGGCDLAPHAAFPLTDTY